MRFLKLKNVEKQKAATKKRVRDLRREHDIEAVKAFALKLIESEARGEEVHL